MALTALPSPPTPSIPTTIGATLSSCSMRVTTASFFLAASRSTSGPPAMTTTASAGPVTSPVTIRKLPNVYARITDRVTSGPTLGAWSSSTAASSAVEVSTPLLLAGRSVTVGGRAPCATSSRSSLRVGSVNLGCTSNRAVTFTPAPHELVAEQDRRRLLGEVLLPVGVLLEVVDLVTVLVVLLAQPVDLVVERVDGRAVERGRADDEPDGEREEHRGQRDHVVPKVDHEKRLLVTRTARTSGCPTTPR